MDDQHKLSLPRFRSQINHILMTEKKTDFVGYMNELHKVGEAAYKRSSIPNENMIEAAQELKGIKRVRTGFSLLEGFGLQMFRKAIFYKIFISFFQMNELFPIALL